MSKTESISSQRSPQGRSQKKMGLGRGLGSLLGGPAEEEASPEVLADIQASRRQNTKMSQPSKISVKEEVSPAEPLVAENNKDVEIVPKDLRVWKVAIEKIKGNKEQPRKTFPPEEIDTLARSIAEQGILQPILVRQIQGDEFEIIAGERRWRAAQKAGLHEVPVLIKEITDQKSLELALIENIQRQDLNSIEEAEAYSYIIDKYGLTQQQLADKLGIERVSIANKLRLLNLQPKVRELVLNGQLSLGQAKLIVSVSDAKKQLAIAKKVKDDKLTVRATEKLVKKAMQSAEFLEQSLGQPEVNDRLVRGLAEELQKMTGTKVNIDYSKGKGKIHIQFYSDDELNQIVDKLRKAWRK